MAELSQGSKPHHSLTVTRKPDGQYAVQMEVSLLLTVPPENVEQFGSEAVGNVLADRICREFVNDRDEMARTIREGCENLQPGIDGETAANDG